MACYIHINVNVLMLEWGSKFQFTGIEEGRVKTRVKDNLTGNLKDLRCRNQKAVLLVVIVTCSLVLILVPLLVTASIV